VASNDRTTLDADRAYYSSRHWREVARPRALRSRPLCEHCELRGIVRAATQVDHIRRPKGDRYLQRHPNNLQCLCTDCHQHKSNWERRNDSRPLRIGVAVDAGPLSCGMGAASGGGGRCKPIKDRRVCEQLGGV
jgi:5-methylcytosine-specific restriction endonuclease McrA